ncbi:dynactin subunit 2-like [Saccostrea echinata]|uniref:dynactin subunit 2-like n=1 Tax=Saccostrea echinata TaxID=191078 RepID=UPI002A83D978|nr:dynactin subunit 2-like [Saccostrea echinata]
MADPKYANLPGIDHDAPDVYETEDLPEDDQAMQLPQEEASDNIEKLTLDTNAALGKFKGSEVKADELDFSDRITGSRRTGYDIEKTEYEMLEDGSSKIETPQQKFQRLQHEIRELGEEVHTIKENVKKEVTANKTSPVDLSKQLEYLQHQLNDLHLEKLLGPEAKVDLSDPQGQLQKRLLTELAAYKPTEGKPASGAKTGSGCVTYELFYRPEQAQFSRNARLAKLEERLERLEAVLGQSSDKVGILTADTDNKGVVESVGVLNSKLSLLEPSNIDQVDVRLASVLQKLNQIADKKTGQADLERQNKVSELYDMVKKWDSVRDTLPHVVDRLVSLKELHEQALQFSQLLSHLDTAQQEITTTLAAHGDMMKQLQVMFQENSKTVKSNCESLDQRLKALGK